MHIACMATKTISLRLEAYERLRRARRFPGESFSEVVNRATWPTLTVTGRELLDRIARDGADLTEEEIDRIERVKADADLPGDKWAEG